jgi:acyl-CoA synthetase (AMP-forming)/AMP-acid ligase II
MNDLLAQHNPSSVAILDADQGTATTYGQLLTSVTQTSDFLRRELGHGVVFHVATNTVASIVVYLSCLELGCPVGLLEPGPNDRLERLLQAFEPDAVVMPREVETPAGVPPGSPLPDGAYKMSLRRAARGARPLHRNLSLLLTTSGSTGSPKLVRLTQGNVLANAHSIVDYLGIQPGERSIQSLPMHYSYGLSLVNSHLAAGATVVLTRHSFMRPEFWDGFDQTKCTSFAGVPYMYETLHRLQFNPKQHPTMRTMTQAGGGLRRDLIQSFYESSSSAGCRFFVMYGQTEATARISYVPFEQLGEKIGSIGIPIPNGHLSLASAADSDQQELMYSGPNVMMGYAETAADLANGDELGGTLRTGDLATVDSDGFFFLAGRLKRFAKLFGRRISLEDVEKDLEMRYPIHAAAIDRDGQLTVFAVARDELLDRTGIARYLAQRLSVPPKYITVDAIAEIPMTASGKKDYKTLSS